MMEAACIPMGSIRGGQFMDINRKSFIANNEVETTMSKLFALALVGALFASASVEAATKIDKAAIEKKAAMSARGLGDTPCSLCFTCGGRWPVFSGAIPAGSTADPNERGSACAGDFQIRSDARPQLCCKKR
jgi:hypothetical protein